MFCKNCGKELSDTAHFCSQCGKKVSSQKEQEKYSESTAEEFYARACEFAQNNNFIDAVPFFEKAAALDNEDAISSLAMIYIDGKGIPPDYEKGLKYLLKSVNSGNPFSINYLGTLYLEGRGGIPQDYEQAFISFNIAAENGYPYAILNLAYCYENGFGTETNIDEAINCYFDAINGGYSEDIIKNAIEELLKYEHIPSVQIFLKRLSASSDDIEGFTELMKAALQNSSEEAKKLIDDGADLEEKDINGYTALMWAVFYDSLDVAKLLIESSADIEAKRNDGVTPLTLAAEMNSVETAQLLIEKGANVEAESDGHSYPLGSAAYENSIEVAKLLIKSGANINANPDYGGTPLGWAALNNAFEIAKLLIESGAIIDLKNSLGYTPLYLAVNGHNLEMMKLLIDYGADVNEKDNFNTTILINAVNEDFVGGVKLLLAHNADISPVDDLNRTVFTIAKERNKTEILNLLNSAELYNLAKKCIIFDDFQKSDTKLYIELLEKSAEGGFAEAQYELGKMYESGLYVEKDIDKAIAWLEKAASQENEGAVYTLQYLK